MIDIDKLVLSLYKHGSYAFGNLLDKCLREQDIDISQLKHNPFYIYVITRCEEHSDYVEAAFVNEDDAAAYCNKFNEDTTNDYYHRDITKIELKF